MELPDGRVRKLRENYDIPGHCHELTFCCLNRMQLLRQERTRRWMVDAMELARRKHTLRILAYVIMPEHVHVLLRPILPEYSMAAIRKTIKQSVSRRAVAWLKTNSPKYLERMLVEWPGGRTEYRFWEQGGGYDRNMTTNDALINAIRYLHMNPVRAGLVKTPMEWEWSSARAYAKTEPVVMQVDHVRLSS